MSNKLCAKLSRYSKTIDGNIKYILGEIFAKYEINTFESISRNDDTSYAILIAEDGRKVLLNINTDRVYLINKFKNIIEEYKITSAGDVFITTYEKRPKGVIISEARKEYHNSKDDKNEKINTNLEVTRYTLSNKKINELIPDFSSSSFSPINLAKFAKEYRNHIKYKIETIADTKTYYNSFLVTHYHTLFSCQDMVSSNPSGMHIYIDGEEVSSYYETIDGKNKLDIIYDLFMGNINKDNIDTLSLITLGLMDKDGYDLYSKLKYREQEDEVVGGSIIKKSQSYKFATKKLIAQNYKISRFTNIDTREAILDILRYTSLTDEGMKRILK